MKPTVLFFTVLLLVTACRNHKDSADGKMQKQLAGTWFFEARYAQGGDTEQTIAVAPDGSYTQTIFIPSAKNGHVRTISLEGCFRVEGGFLVETITKHSQNLPVPITNRSRIVRMDGRELVLEYEKRPGVVYPTNQIAFLKQTK